MRQAVIRNQTVIQLFFGLLLLMVAWQPELIFPFFFTLRATKLDKLDEGEDFKLCHSEKVSDKALQHTFFGQSVPDYFNIKEGVLTTYKIGLERINQQCTIIQSKKFSQLINGIRSVLLDNRILFIAENHFDYFAMGYPSGNVLIKSIMQCIPGDVIFFTEYSKDYIKDFESVDFPIISMVDSKSDYSIFSGIVLYLPDMLILQYLSPEVLTMLEGGLLGLFLHNKIDVWLQIKNEIEADETEIYKHIIAGLLKQKSGCSLEEMTDYVNKKFIPLLEQSMVSSIFNLFFKIINYMIVRIKVSNIPEKRQEQLAILKNYGNAVETFSDEMVQHSLGVTTDASDFFNTFKSNSVSFVVDFQNILWVDTINQHIEQYVKEHKSERPYIIILAGGAHIPGLKTRMEKGLYAHTQLHP